eukprot:g14920.t1
MAVSSSKMGSSSSSSSGIIAAIEEEWEEKPLVALVLKLEYWQYLNMEDEDPQTETPFGCWDFGQVWAQAEDNETWINIKAPMCQTTNWEKVSIKLSLPDADKVKYRFRFHSVTDINVGMDYGFEGWFLDDVRVIGGSCGGGMKFNDAGTACQQCEKPLVSADGELECYPCPVGLEPLPDQSGCFEPSFPPS